MFGILPDLSLPLSFRLPMAREFNNDGIKLLLKKTFLIAPGILSSSSSMDEKDKISSLYEPFSSCPVMDLSSSDADRGHGSLL